MTEEGFYLCIDSEEYSLQLPETLSIYFSRLGDPMRVFKIKQNDTAPALTATVLDRNDNPVELTDLNEVKFIMRECFFFKESNDTEIKVQNSENVSLDPVMPGRIQYNWQPEDTDTSSDYRGEFQITLGGIKSAAGASFDLEDGQTLLISVDGAPAQTVTFNLVDFADIGAATIAEIVAVINAQLVGGLARETRCYMAVLLQTQTTDLTGSIQVVGGTANDELQFPTALDKNRRITLPEKALPIAILEDLDDN